MRTEAPALAIFNVAAECRADMIVMTSHGRTGFSRWVFGSVAEHVARQAEVPVLVLRERQLPFWTDGAEELVETPPHTGQSGPLPVLRVLVPLDGSPLAETVLDPAASCVRALVQGVRRATGRKRRIGGCLLHLVLVVRPIDAIPRTCPRPWWYRVRRSIWAKWLPDFTISILIFRSPATVIAEGDVAGALIGILEGEEEYSLLAMATHGRTGITRWIWGSITERMVQKTQLPILLVRPH